MTGLGIIGTGAAWLNLKNAEAEYAKLKEQQEALEAAIQSYQFSRDYETGVDTKPNNMPEGVEYTGMLRVSNVVGQMFRAQASIVMTNTSDETYYIRYARIDTFFEKLPILIYNLDWDGLIPSGSHQVPQNILVNQYIQPGQTLEFKFDRGLSALPAEQMNKLRELLCVVAGKRLVTSIIDPVNIIDGITANIVFGWMKKGETELNECYTNGKIGVLRYMTENVFKWNAE